MRLKSLKDLKEVSSSHRPNRRQSIRQYTDGNAEPAGTAWPLNLVRAYPVEKLPRVWFIDLDGITLVNAFKSFDEAVNTLLWLYSQYPIGLTLREYAPTPEEYEEYCAQDRSRKRWAGGRGA